MNSAEERRDACKRLVEERGEVSLADLVSALNASEATVRRDLSLLEEQGFLARTHGGARRLPSPSLVARTFEQKRDVMRAEKEQIARAAAALVTPGMSLALDSGTTVWRIAEQLKSKAPLVIFTSALAVAETLGPVPGITLHMTGGRFRLDNLDFVGARACAACADFRADLAFISADALAPGRGCFSDDEDSAVFGACLARCANQVWVPVDHGKIARKSVYRILPANEIDGMITDTGLTDALARQLREQKISLRIAAGDAPPTQEH